MTRRWQTWLRYLREPRWETALRRRTGKSGGPAATHELHKKKNMVAQSGGGGGGRSCFGRIHGITVFHFQESKHNHPRLLVSN